LNGFPPADNSVSPSLSTAALSQYCLIRPHGQKRVRLHSVNVNSQGWRTSLDTSWCIRAGVGLKLFGHEHYPACWLAHWHWRGMGQLAHEANSSDTGRPGSPHSAPAPRDTIKVLCLP